MKNKTKPKEEELKTIKELREMPLLERVAHIAKNHKRYQEEGLCDGAGFYSAVLAEVTYEDNQEKDESIKPYFPELEREKRQIWQVNNVAIQKAIHEHLQDYSSFPSTARIAERTGLSRQTVHKHLNDPKLAGLYDQKGELLRLCAEKTLTVLYSMGMRYADTKAMSLFLKYSSEMLKEQQEQSKPTNQFIQINNIYINQETIQNLPNKKRQQIEDILLNSPPEENAQ